MPAPHADFSRRLPEAQPGQRRAAPVTPMTTRKTAVKGPKEPKGLARPVWRASPGGWRSRLARRLSDWPVLSALLALPAVMVQTRSQTWPYRQCFQPPARRRRNDLPPFLMPIWQEQTGCGLEPAARLRGAPVSVPALAAD